MQSTLDTSGLSGREGFDFWQTVLNEQTMPVAARSRAADTFSGSMKASDFGAIKTVVTVSRSVDVTRTTAMIRRGDPEAYFLVLNFEGTHQMVQDRKAGCIEAGDMVLLHSSRPFASEADTRHSHQVGSVVMLETNALPMPARALQRLVAVPFSSTDGTVALASRYLYTLGTNQFDPRDASRLSAVAMDLLSLMFARRLQVDLPGDTRANALHARIQTYLLDRLGDPTLSPETIAAAHHISVRTLHRLFQANEATVAGWIRAHRLERCRRDLVDPTMATRTVRAIGQRWTFTDPAHFNRLFTATYGLSPRAYRAHHQGSDPHAK